MAITGLRSIGVLAIAAIPGGLGGNGQEWHRFTKPLRRQVTVAGVCVVCERDVHPHEGPQTPRAYEFAARYIAEALIAVGPGAPTGRPRLGLAIAPAGSR